MKIPAEKGVAFLCSLVLGSAAFAQQAIHHELSPPPVELRTQVHGAGLAVGTRVLFVAHNSEFGGELFVSDGTVAGTHLAVDCVTGPASSAERVHGVVGGRAWTGTYLSDGTRTGTTRIASHPPVDTVLGNAGGALLFDSPGDGTWGAGTYALDATGHFELLLAGTTRKTLLTENATSYLVDGASIFATDGTSVGTTPHLTLPGPARFLDGGRFWFVQTVGFVSSLCTADALTGAPGPVLLTPFGHSPSFVRRPNGVVFTMAGSTSLWTSDGTPNGTRPLNTGFDAVLSIAPWRDRAIVFAHDPVRDVQAWISDGTDAGTHLLVDLSPRTLVPEFAATQQATWLCARNGARFELIHTDGTAAGTRVVSDHPLAVRDMRAVGTRLFALVGSPYLPRTPIVADAQLGATEVLMLDPARLAGRLALTGQTITAGGAFIFQGKYTMASRGTAATTHRIAGPSRTLGGPVAASLGDTVLVPETAGLFGSTWRAWDTASEARVPATLPGERTPILAATNLGDVLLYATASELVITNGVGTTRLPLPTSHATRSLLATAAHVFVTGDGLASLDLASGQWRTVDASGRELLAVVGTRVVYVDASDRVRGTDGTVVEDLGFLRHSGWIDTPLSWQGRAWFWDLAFGIGWSTDGTLAGTLAHPTPVGLSLLDVATREDAFYLAARDDAHGSELWRYDGLAWSRVTDLAIGPFDGVLAVDTCGDRLFLAASDGTDGIEPYVSDGTAAGTRRIADLMPGPTSSLPTFLRLAGDHAYFTAGTPGRGNVMAVPLGQLGVAHSERIGQGCVGRGGIPQLTTPQPPRLGDATFRFELAAAAPLAPALFAIDTATMLQQYGPCRLRCAGGLGTALRLTNGSGSASWNVPIPASSVLLGLHVTAQGVVFDSFASGPGFAVSTALGCVVGG